MKRVIGDRERAQRATARLCVLQHFEQVSRNISRTCRFFGISRSLFYQWRRRYQREGVEGLRPRLPGPRVSPFRTAPHIEALVLRVRQERQYGIPCLRSSSAGIMPSLCPHRRSADPTRTPCPSRLPEALPASAQAAPRAAHPRSVGPRGRQASQNAVGSPHHFTAIDEATRYRVLKIHDHNSIQSAVHFINEVRSAFPAAIRRFQTDNGSEWAPTSPGTCTISASPTRTSRPAARSPMGRSSAVIAPTRRNSTAG
jgi:transposase-like protein